MDKTISIGILNYRPIAMVLRKILVPSISALFHVYHAAIPAGTKMLFLCRFSIVIVVALF